MYSNVFWPCRELNLKRSRVGLTTMKGGCAQLTNQISPKDWKTLINIILKEPLNKLPPQKLGVLKSPAGVTHVGFKLICPVVVEYLSGNHKNGRKNGSQNGDQG